MLIAVRKRFSLCTVFLKGSALPSNRAKAVTSRNTSTMPKIVTSNRGKSVAPGLIETSVVITGLTTQAS